MVFIPGNNVVFQYHARDGSPSYTSTLIISNLANHTLSLKFSILISGCHRDNLFLKMHLLFDKSKRINKNHYKLKSPRF